MADAVLVLDCGATNVRAIAVSAEGRILVARSVPNAASPDPGFPGGRIWDHDRIWRDFAASSRAVQAELGPGRIGAVTVTTFGVDGTLVDREGTPLHPVIAWQCERTAPLIEAVTARLPRLYERCGVQAYPFNTIYKLAWLVQNRPAAVGRAHAWLFLSNLFQHRMTGGFATDATMAGTSMLTDLETRAFSPETLGSLGLAPGLFPREVEAGTVVGELLPAAAEELGLSPGLPVVSAGHDTQFALYGSGVDENEPVLSSGTWEILMVRTRRMTRTEALQQRGVTVEFDVERGLCDPGVMWIASGLLEWLRRLAFGDLAGDAAYETMITEGSQAGPGSGGLRFAGDPLANQGTFSGLGLGTTRGQMARAIFEHLAFRARTALALLEGASGFRAESIRCVGGGSKNRLWNQIRADVLGRPVRVVDRKETTALGAACFAMPALGLYRDAKSARAAARIASLQLEPGPAAAYYSDQNP
jgi:L-fuculokinase